MAFDALDGYVVLFGGFSPSAEPTSDTWIFLNNEWTNISSTAGTPPSPRYGMGMTYDALDGYLLAFGGSTTTACPPSTSSECNDTWLFYGGKWTQRTLVVAPPETWGVGMAYDAADSYVVLFGGSPGVGTWNYSHGTWNQIASASNTTYVQPSARTGMGMTYDVADGYVVLFGGYGINEVLGDTWRFVGGVWTALTSSPSAPSPREALMMAYHNATRTVLLFGGDSYIPDPPPYGPLNDTWSFAGGSWTNVTSGRGPAARGSGSMTYDANDSCVLLFGGTEELGTAGNQNDTWGWCAAPPVVGLSILADREVPLPGESVAFGASFAGGVPPFTYSWAFGDGSTSASSNPVHSYSAAGYYPVRLWLNDSAAHDVNATRVIHVYVPLAAPSVSANPNPAFLGQPVNFSSTDTGGTPPYTYAWNFGDGGTGGNLSNITHIYTTNGPFEAGVTITDSLGAFASAFVSITIQLQALMQSSALTGSPPLAVTFTGGAQGGLPPYSYSWDFGDSTPISTVQNPNHIFGSSGTYTVVLVVTDAEGNHATNSIRVQVGTGPSEGAGAGALALPLIAGLLGFGAGVATVAGLRFWRRKRDNLSSLEDSKKAP
jgi:PKD repeat protein